MMNLKPLTDLLHAGSTHGDYNQASIDAATLRRISMTLHRWHEMECGTDGGCIERGHTKRVGDRSFQFQSDENGFPYWANHNGERTTYQRMPDRETGALKRLAAIMKSYPLLVPYVQGDPRGAALYVVRKDNVPAGGTLDAYYSRGMAVYK